MPILSTTLSAGATGTSVQTLHAELLSSGISIDPAEADSGSFGDATKNAVLAFQEKFGIEPTGSVDPATGALMTATAAFAADGNTPEVRQTLRTAADAMPDAPPRTSSSSSSTKTAAWRC